ncbi:hypothetical protein Dsin_033095 [Dipteronia sinensis]|uniref:Peptidase C1A papain C-terminal domain-containing protein n=1 Tax=Dipteronia sinensis TaxID=43782 RepID=A0AAD9Z9G9_9ROSI|nr:hypothetical protein Dsin_033095 [Dipteronia sinensis]
MEGFIKLSTEKLISLSEQELVDCDKGGVNHDCNGGFIDDAFRFIIHNKGLMTESNYPYNRTDGSENSWGTGWGENGHMRIQRDVDAPKGLCGIAMQASYPTAA